MGTPLCLSRPTFYLGWLVMNVAGVALTTWLGWLVLLVIAPAALAYGYLSEQRQWRRHRRQVDAFYTRGASPFFMVRVSPSVDETPASAGTEGEAP